MENKLVVTRREQETDACHGGAWTGPSNLALGQKSNDRNFLVSLSERFESCKS